jgi:hypothetical protein
MALPKEFYDLYSEPMIAKFMATVGPDNRPNVSFVASIDTWKPESDFLIFGEFLMVKTQENLKHNKKVGLLAVNLGLSFAQAIGDFNGDWVNKGPYFDKISYNDMFRYNAYTKIRKAGTIAVKSCYPRDQIGKLTIVKELVSVKTRMRRFKQGAGVEIPLTVKKKYDQMQAIKAIAYIPEGEPYPFVSPAMSVYPIDRRSLAFTVSSYNTDLARLKNGQHVAVMVLTMDPIVYQVKGTVDSFNGTFGRIVLTEAFSSSPPLAGKKIA